MSTNDSDKLAARELASAVNTPELLAEHNKVNNGKVRTRFPPEPNGYLHVGHCKSMCMNFELAFEKLEVAADKRETIFRYDDTNPEAECNEYIESLAEDVAWLGWKPIRTTYTSDYFDELYDFAIRLIKEGNAYVCHQTKAEIEACREIAKAKVADPNATGNPNSPWRDRPVEENLKLFNDMKNGKFESGAATLRLKMDMTSPNPNMWDQVAYRIKYVPHPHAGDKWCIYPTYDYTHCIIDSLEHIDYSICTLEFESRRESYYWVLEALGLYRPKVYEMSRLNLCYTVLSKRKLLKLVSNGYMRGWDDPRMPTIKGLRRRGYTREAMNAFCREVGVTRTENFVQYERLENVVRNTLNDTAPRVMGIVRPVRVRLSDRPAGAHTAEVPNYPFDPSRGQHNVVMDSDVIYIDAADFRLEEDDDFFGLVPGKEVGLKYCPFTIRCDSVAKNADGEVLELSCTCIPRTATSVKPKGVIQWVCSSNAVPCEIRLYEHLFIKEDVDDALWEAQLNPNSEIVTSGFVDPSIYSYPYKHEFHVQFERIGFFVIDKDSDVSSPNGKLVFNLTVNLRDSKPKVDGGRSRKAEQAKQLADKLARMNIDPVTMFRTPENLALYSQWDENGVPTHDQAGEPLSKNKIKTLKKDWEKQQRLFESSKTTSTA